MKNIKNISNMTDRKIKTGKKSSQAKKAIALLLCSCMVMSNISVYASEDLVEETGGYTDISDDVVNEEADGMVSIEDPDIPNEEDDRMTEEEDIAGTEGTEDLNVTGEDPSALIQEDPTGQDGRDADDGDSIMDLDGATISDEELLKSPSSNTISKNATARQAADELISKGYCSYPDTAWSYEPVSAPTGSGQDESAEGIIAYEYYDDGVLVLSLKEGVGSTILSTVPDDVKDGIINASGGIENISQIYIGDGFTQINSGALGVFPDIEYAFMADGMQSIGSGAFAGLQKLKFIGLSCSIENLGSGCFANCPSLIGHLDLPMTIRSASNIISGSMGITRVTFPYLGCGNGYSPFFNSVIAGPHKVHTVDLVYDGDAGIAADMPLYYAFSNYIGDKGLCHMYLHGKFDRVSGAHSITAVPCEVVFMDPAHIIRIDSGALSGSAKLAGINISEWTNLEYIGSSAFSTGGDISYWAYKDHTPVMDKAGVLDMSSCLSLKFVDSAAFAYNSISEFIPPAFEPLAGLPDENPYITNSISPRYKNFTTYYSNRPFTGNKVPMKVDVSHMHGCFAASGLFGATEGGIISDLYFPEDFGGAHYGGIFGVDIDKDFLGKTISYPVTAMSLSGPYAEGPAYQLFNGTPGLNAPNLEKLILTPGSDLYGREGYYNHSDYGFNRSKDKDNYDDFKVVIADGIYAICGNASGNVDFDFSENHTLKIFAPGYTGDDFDEDWEPDCEHTQEGLDSFFSAASTTFVGNGPGDVILPETVEYIGPRAFRDSSIKTRLHIPAGVKYMGEGAFMGCAFAGTDGEGMLDLSRNVDLLVIPEHCFSNCKGITGIKLPPNMRKIDTLAFSGLDSFSGDLILPDTLQVMEGICFGGTNVTGKLRFPEKMPYSDGKIDSNGNLIDEASFDGDPDGRFTSLMENTGLIKSRYAALDIPVDYFEAHTSQEVISDNLQELTLRKGVTGVMDDFTNSDSDTFRNLFKHVQIGVINIGEGVKNIGDYAFTGTNVSKIETSGNTALERIGQGAFMNCSKLSGSFIVPDNVHFIGDDAFTGTGIDEIHFPVTVLPGDGQIRRIFQDCPNLKKFIFTQGTDNPLLDRKKGVWIDLEAPDTWENAPYSRNSGGSIVIERGVKNIGKNALVNANNIESVIMPVDIDIDKDAFNENFFKEVVLTEGNDFNDIPDSTEDDYMKNPWIKSKSNLVHIDMDRLVSENRVNDKPRLNRIGDYAFYEAGNIDMILPSSVTEIGDYSFYKNKAQCLSMFDMSNLERVGKRAFYECTTLPAVVDLSEVASLGEESYYNCPNIDGIYISSRLIDDHLGKDDGSIDYRITNGYAIYDGTLTDGGAMVEVDDTEYTVKYGLKKHKINSYDMPKFSEAGSHNVFFTISRDDVIHVTGKVIITITEPVDDKEFIEYTTTNGEAHYDGKLTDGGAMVEVDESAYPGYTIKFSTDTDEYLLNSIPKYREAGTYKVYFRITAEGYKDTYGNLLIAIYKNKSNIYTDMDRVYLYNGRSSKVLKAWSDNGRLDIKDFDAAKISVSINKTSGATEDAPAILTITAVDGVYEQSRLTLASDFDAINSVNSKTILIDHKDSEGEMVAGFDFRNSVKDYLEDGDYDFIFITSSSGIITYDGKTYDVPADEADLLDLSTDGGFTTVAFVAGDKFFISSADNDISFNEDSSFMFDGFKDSGINIKRVDFVDADTSKIRDLTGMFMDSGAAQVSLTGFDTSAVKEMDYMFYGNDMTGFDLSALDTSSARDISYMFSKTSGMDHAYTTCTLDISDTEKINSIFEGSDISDFNAKAFFGNSVSVSSSKIKDASSMFKGCDKLEDADLIGLSMESVTDVSSFFEGCGMIKNINIPFKGKDIKKGCLDDMFTGCIMLETLDLSAMECLGNDPDGTDMFGTAVDDSPYYRYVITSGWAQDKEYDYHIPQYADKAQGAPLRLKTITLPASSKMSDTGHVRLPFAMKAKVHLRTGSTTYEDKEYVVRDLNRKITETVYLSSSQPSAKAVIDLSSLTSDYLTEMAIDGHDTLGVTTDKGSIGIDSLYYMDIDKATGLTYYAYRDMDDKDCIYITGEADKDLTAWDTKEYDYGGLPYNSYMYDYEKTSGVWRKYNYRAYEPEWQAYYSLVTKHIGFGGNMSSYCADQLFRQMGCLETIIFTDDADISNVFSARYMFEGCTMLKSLDLNDTYISTDTDITGMFKNDNNLGKIFCKHGWDAYQSPAMPYKEIFEGCTSLDGYDDQHTDSSYCIIGNDGYFSDSF